MPNIIKHFALLLLSVTLSFASIGKIAALNGDISITRDSKNIKAVAGSTLEQKDVIKASKGSAAQIVFNDKTVITVGSATTFKIEEYLFDEKTPNAKFKVEEGSFKAITGKIGKIAPEKFKLETKTATIGIRGTAFVGKIDKDGLLRIACTKGAITVTPNIPNTPTPPTVVPAGQMTNANNHGVEPPKPFTPGDLKDLGGDLGGYAKKDNNDNTGNGNSNQNNNNDNKDKDNKTAGVDNGIKDKVSDTTSTIVNSKNNDVVGAASGVNGWAAAYGGDYVPGKRYVIDGYSADFSDGDGIFFSAIQNLKIAYNGDSNSSVVYSNADKEDKVTVILDGSKYGSSQGTATTAFISVDDDKADYVSWGYWATTYNTQMLGHGFGFWVGGALTQLSDMPQNTSATYSGKVMGAVTNGVNMFDTINTSTSNVNLNINFGATSSITGNMAFNTAGGQSWNLVVGSGAVSNNTFSGGFSAASVISINGTSSTLSSGAFDGSFYGPNAASIGGSFSANTSSYNAAGVFKANKQ